MVSFLKGLGSGIFEGFNDKMEAADAFETQKKLIAYQNSFKEEIIDDTEHETLSYLDPSTGKMVTEDLYALRNRKDYNEGEFDKYRMETFFTNNISTPDYMNKLLATNPAKFAALVRKGDTFAYSWHNNPDNYQKNPADGETTWNKGDQYSAVKGSWHMPRFNQIALSKIPTDDYGLPALRIETDSGVFFQNQNKPIQDWGYETTEELYKDMNLLRYLTNDSRSVDEILSSKEAGFFKTYAKLKPIIMNIQASNHNLNYKNLGILQQEFNGLQPLSEEQRAAGEQAMPVNEYFYANYNRQFEFLKMVAPTWLMNDKGSTYGKISNPVKYMAKHLGIEPKELNGKRTASIAAGITIDKLLGEFFNENGDIIFDDTRDGARVAKYGVVGWLVGVKEGLFGTGGLKDQFESFALKYNVENRVSSARINALESAVRNAGDEDALLIAQRNVFYELLAYQVAAAIQGGTGGRTISDADVANIKKALGIGGLSTGPLQYRRLTVLRGFMKQIELLNSGYTAVGSNMKNVIAAGQMHQLILGGNIQSYTSGNFLNTFDNKMKNLESTGAVGPLDPEVEKKIRGIIIVTGDNGLTATSIEEVEAYILKNQIPETEANKFRKIFNHGIATYD